MQLVSRRISPPASTGASTSAVNASAAVAGGTEILDLACGMGGDLLKWFTPSNNSKQINVLIAHI